MGTEETLGFDIRTEAYAAALLNTNDELNDIHQILVKLNGLNGRPTGKDISHISRSTFFENEKPTPFLYLDVSREGLIDLIPQSIFAEPSLDTDDVVSKVEMFDQRRKELVKFLLPFEQSIFQPRIAIEQSESDWVLGESIALERMFVEFIYTSFEKFADRENPQLESLVKKLVPYLPWSQLFLDDVELRMHAIESIMETEIKLLTKPGTAIEIPQEFMPSLGQTAHLGENFIIGDSFLDGLVVNMLQVNVAGLEDIQMWMPDGLKHNFVQNLLVHLFFPADMQVSISLNVNDNMRLFYLSDATDVSRLGYVTYL